MKHYPIGSVSCATMRHEDLIPTFCYELSNMPGVSRAHKRLVREIEARISGKASQVNSLEQSADYYASEDPVYDLESLYDALGAYAAPFMYFGSHPGDGADYGFWLSEDFHTEDGVLRVSDLSEVEPDYVGWLAVVNDHGNVTLYRRGSNHRNYEVWSLV